MTMKTWKADRYTMARSLGIAVLAGVVVLTATPAWAQLNQTLHYDGWILAAAHAPGMNESIWRTDLWLVLDSRGSGPVTLRFCQRGTDNTTAWEYVAEFSEGQEVLYIEDVVDQYLDLNGGTWVGAIHYTSGTPLQAWARVYSVNAAGTESFGQVIEGIPTSDMSPDQPTQSDMDAHQWLYAARHTSDDRFRVNIGVVNPTAVEGSYAVKFFDATGNNPPGKGAVQREITVPPFSMVQLTDPFADVMGGEWNAVQIRVVGYTVGSGNFAYASVVDNETNDAFFVRGVKRLFPTE